MCPWKDLTEEGVSAYLNKKVGFSCALTIQPGGVVCVPPGWHMWRQNGGSGGQSDCKDLVCFEAHCLPRACATRAGMENMRAYVNLMQQSKDTPKDLMVELNFAKGCCDTLLTNLGQLPAAAIHSVSEPAAAAAAATAAPAREAASASPRRSPPPHMLGSIAPLAKRPRTGAAGSDKSEEEVCLDDDVTSDDGFFNLDDTGEPAAAPAAETSIELQPAKAAEEKEGKDPETSMEQQPAAEAAETPAAAEPEAAAVETPSAQPEAAAAPAPPNRMQLFFWQQACDTFVCARCRVL